MRIEELTSLYEFLANIGWLGIVGAGLFAAGALLLSVFLLNKEKTAQMPPKLQTIGWPISFVLIVTSICLLKSEAGGRQDVIKVANCIKSEFIIGGFKVMKDSDLLLTSACVTVKGRNALLVQSDLENLLNIFPTEFIRVRTDDGSPGIRMIDPVALSKIDTYNITHLPFIRSAVLEYMLRHGVDSITYQMVRDKVDDDFDDEWIELMISKYDSVFIPFKNSVTTKLYSASHGFKLRKKWRLKAREHSGNQGTMSGKK